MLQQQKVIFRTSKRKSALAAALILRDRAESMLRRLGEFQLLVRWELEHKYVLDAIHISTEAYRARLLTPGIEII
jgi:hypothetical protein